MVETTVSRPLLIKRIEWFRSDLKDVYAIPTSGSYIASLCKAYASIWADANALFGHTPPVPSDVGQALPVIYVALGQLKVWVEDQR